MGIVSESDSKVLNKLTKYCMDLMRWNAFETCAS